MRRLLAVSALATLTVAGCGGAPSPQQTPPIFAAATASSGAAASVVSGPPATAGAVVERAQPVDLKATLAVYATAGGRVLARLQPRTHYGSVLTVLVDSTTPLGAGWLRVYLPTKPNGSEGWVKSSSVKVAEVQDAILVNTRTHTVTVAIPGRAPVTGPAAVGTSTDPTPKGLAYVTDVLWPANPHGAYGSVALGLSLHSTALKDWPDGGQIGLHGTNEAASIGKDASHGCIRVPANIDALLAQIPLGTPVTIA